MPENQTHSFAGNKQFIKVDFHSGFIKTSLLKELSLVTLSIPATGWATKFTLC